MKLLSLLVGAVGVVMVTGFPAVIPAAPSVFTRWHSVSQPAAPAAAAIAAPDPARWTESGSLVLLATGMFGAAVLIGRRRA